MTNQIGERYICSDPNCGCEVEIILPCGARGESGRRAAENTRRTSPELFTPPSKTLPREEPGIEMGAGERRRPYGSPTRDEELPGAFRDEEETIGETIAGRSPATTRTERSGLTCFCGSLMVLTDARSASARAGRSL